MSDNQKLNGVIPVHKDPGMTSHDVVARLRRILKTKQVGHTGTLDPEVSGVLPICVGQATRISEYIMEMPKEYRGQMVLGIATTTEDFTGETIETKQVEKLSVADVQNGIHSFIGEIEQIPPMYSSVKIQGKRLYELAREGKVIERKPRKVTIYDLKLINVDLDKTNPTIDFQVTCSKGTYVRTLCVDIGKKLGYPAHMSKLIRTSSGAFKIDQSYTISEIETLMETNQIQTVVTPMAEALPYLEKIQLTNDEIHNKIYNGQRISLDSPAKKSGLVKIVDNEGNLAALYEKSNNSIMLKPKKVFKPAEE